MINHRLKLFEDFKMKRRSDRLATTMPRLPGARQQSFPNPGLQKFIVVGLQEQFLVRQTNLENTF